MSLPKVQETDMSIILRDEFIKAYEDDKLEICFEIFERFVKTLEGADQANGQLILIANRNRHSSAKNRKGLSRKDEKNYLEERLVILRTLFQFINDH